MLFYGVVSAQTEKGAGGGRHCPTTRTYLHLASVVFRDEAEQLERRLLGSIPESEPQGVEDSR